MVRFRFSRLSVSGCKAAAVVLAWAFVSGLAAGGLVSSGCGELLADSRSALSVDPGVSVFVPTVLPLLVSGCAVFIRQPLLLIPTAFWKAFSFSFVGSALAMAWGSGGWLVAGLASFGSLCGLAVLWWYWLRHIGGGEFSSRTFLPALGAMLIIGWMDLLLICPFLENILIF